MRRWAAELGWPTWCAALALCVAGLYPIDNPDTFGHLAAGREIVQLGHVPKLDSFSYWRPEPAPWVNYEWLSDALFYSVYRLGGYPALNALKLSLLAVLAGLLVALARKRAGELGAALCALLIVSDLPGLRFRLSVRPHLFGLVLGALYLLGLVSILEARSRRSVWRWVFGLAIAHVAWVNLHGSHLLGLALTAIACVCALRQSSARGPLAALLGLELLASCVSPYGPMIVSGALAHVFDPSYRELIDEWQAWRPPQPIIYPLMLVWQAVCFMFALRQLARDRVRAFSFFAALLLFAMAARSLRFIPDCLALTAPFIAAGLAPPLAAWTARRRTLILSTVGVLATGSAALLCLSLPPRAAFGWGESLRDRPAASAAWLQQYLPDARILAVMPDAWDLMFSLPHAKFLIDGRTPFYGPEHVRRVQRAWGSARELRALIDSTSTDVVVVQPLVTETQPALQALLGFPDFRLVMIEDKHCVFARDTPRRSQLLANSSLRVLRPGYDPQWLLTASANVPAIERELATLGGRQTVQAYRAWVLGLLAARPLVRAEGMAGFATPHNAIERTAALVALSNLRKADDVLRIVPSVSAYHALLAITACQLDEARAVLARAQEQGAARELSFGAEELALRSGDVASVQTFLARARMLPAAAGDVWLAALETAVTAPAVCSTSAATLNHD